MCHSDALVCPERTCSTLGLRHARPRPEESLLSADLRACCWLLSAEFSPQYQDRARREDGEWRMANGEWRTANGERRMANGEWRTANGERRTARFSPDQTFEGTDAPSASRRIFCPSDYEYSIAAGE
ncbi:hypothetical protein BZA05DRAFT_414673 [Tricharina praecox]|uniref:uncharacterized protein n=1 Tax=Tricharina praecox TaxID=43433 RepID=UPI00221E8094|nr:uncharacterized protein BZA05DRAFT_414673 [Tricharina praecox]KAI5858923.1 hypothetical protein BZA05DRAFT_414673 [Tricharina praecox]